ncbi:MAG: hypothetical protein F6K13_09650 [Okeania sp. SIO2B9]|nr:hypothetical protein [Okeania sp. SIO2B9]
MVVLYILYPSSQLPIVRSLAGETVDHFLCEFNTPPSTGVFTHYMGILTPSNFPPVSSIAVSCLLQKYQIIRHCATPIFWSKEIFVSVAKLQLQLPDDRANVELNITHLPEKRE